MKIAVLANGAWDLAWGTGELKSADFLICADGGANSALQSGRLPDILIGDLDSILPENLECCRKAQIRIDKYPKEKDETDLELALLEAFKQAELVKEKDVWLYGATGKRIDHFLGNIALLVAYARQGYRIHLVDPDHQMWIVQGREQIKGSAGQELSLIVLSETAVVSNEGFLYPLSNERLFQASPRGVSNVFLGEEGLIEIHEGLVLVILPNIR